MTFVPRAWIIPSRGRKLPGVGGTRSEHQKRPSLRDGLRVEQHPAERRHVRGRQLLFPLPRRLQPLDRLVQHGQTDGDHQVELKEASVLGNLAAVRHFYNRGKGRGDGLTQSKEMMIVTELERGKERVGGYAITRGGKEVRRW